MTTPTTSLFRGWSLAGCFVAMFVVGMLLSVYGPLVPALQDRFHLGAIAVGAALAVQSFGAVAGVLLAQPLLHRTGNRVTLITSLAAITGGVLVIAVAPTWALVLAGASVAGLGFGGVDSIITQLILTGSGEKGHARVNIAHGCFGLGTVAGPGIVWLLGASNYPWVFGVAAVLGALALVTFPGLQPRPTPAEATAAAGTPAGRPTASRALAAAVIAAFFALYVTHFAVQSGIGNWEPTLLIDQSGISESTATLATSGYWMALVIGRFAAAGLAPVLSAGKIVVVSSIGLAIAVAGSMIPGAPLVAFLIAGFFLGPIFPNGMAWMAQAGFARGNNFAYIIAGSMLGMAIAPTLVGAVIENQGVDVAPVVLAIIGALVAVSSIAVWVTTRSVPRSRNASSEQELASAVDL